METDLVRDCHKSYRNYSKDNFTSAMLK